MKCLGQPSTPDRAAPAGCVLLRGLLKWWFWFWLPLKKRHSNWSSKLFATTWSRPLCQQPQFFCGKGWNFSENIPSNSSQGTQTASSCSWQACCSKANLNTLRAPEQPSPPPTKPGWPPLWFHVDPGFIKPLLIHLGGCSPPKVMNPH